MPEGQERLATVVYRLDRELQEIRGLLVRTPERQPEVRSQRNPRLARTVRGPEDAYPTYASQPTCYRIVFVDATVDDEVGSPSVSLTDRQTSDNAAAFVHVLPGDDPAYIPEGTPIWVFFDRGHWWYSRFGSDRCTCKLKGALATSDTYCTVDNVAPICGANPVSAASDELTAWNIHQFEGEDNADGRIEWNRTTSQWELYQLTCPPE